MLLPLNKGHASAQLGLNAGDVKLEEHNTEGFIFRTANRHEPAIAKNKSFDVVAVKRACVNFTSAKMRKINQAYLGAQEEYNEQAMSIVKQMLQVRD